MPSGPISAVSAKYVHPANPGGPLGDHWDPGLPSGDPGWRHREAPPQCWNGDPRPPSGGRVLGGLRADRYQRHQPPSGKRKTLRGSSRNNGHRLRKTSPSGLIGYGQPPKAKRETLRGFPRNHGLPPALGCTVPSGAVRTIIGISAKRKHPALGLGAEAKRIRPRDLTVYLRVHEKNALAIGAATGRSSSDLSSASPTTPRPSGH
jgi:hypothetical protein